jgi:hypothetical protein
MYDLIHMGRLGVVRSCVCRLMVCYLVKDFRHYKIIM